MLCYHNTLPFGHPVLITPVSCIIYDLARGGCADRPAWDMLVLRVFCARAKKLGSVQVGVIVSLLLEFCELALT